MKHLNFTNIINVGTKLGIPSPPLGFPGGSGSKELTC